MLALLGMQGREVREVREVREGQAVMAARAGANLGIGLGVRVVGLIKIVEAAFVRVAAIPVGDMVEGTLAITHLTLVIIIPQVAVEVALE